MITFTFTNEELANIINASIDFALQKRGYPASLKAEIRGEVRADVERKSAKRAQKSTDSGQQWPVAATLKMMEDEGNL